MELDRYQVFTMRILAAVEAMPDVLGLVAVGSMAGGEREPDEWSDHDFWVIAEAPLHEWLRLDRSWLPDPDRIALFFPETEHGVKVLYDDGHLVEYAVFLPDQLDVARLNHHLVLLDRERVTERIAKRVVATEQQAAELSGDVEFLVGQFLTALLVGVRRHVRGERLSGRELVAGQAVNHLLRLLAALGHPSRTGFLDSIDPRRRFEIAFPGLARHIEHAIAQPTPVAAIALLDLADEELAPRLAAYPTTACAIVRQALSP